MQIADALRVGALTRARVVAGAGGLDREVHWVHVVELPDPLPWVRSGHLLLSTGYAWPRNAHELETLVAAFAERKLAAVGLAVPQFFERMPPAACAVADAANLPLIEIPWEIPFAQITEELHGAILAEQYRVLEQSEAIHRELIRAALEAESLHDLAAALGRLINRAVSIEDVEGRVLAVYRFGDEDGMRRATVERGYSPADLIATLQQRGHLRSLSATTRALRVPPLPELGMRGRVVCPIRVRRERVGMLWIIEGDQPLSELEIRAAENAAIVAALHIAHQRAIASLESQLGQSLLDALLDGLAPTSPALERTRLLGFDPEGSYRIGMLRLETPIPLTREALLKRERISEKLLRTLANLHAPEMLSIRHEQITFLLPDSADAAEVWAAIGGAEVALALGRLHTGLDGVPTGYRELRALATRLGAGRIYRYEELLLPRVLAGDPAARKIFLNDLFGPLRAARNGEMLLQTLVAAAQHGFSLKATASALDLHIKTVRYRLDRAIELANLDLDQPETRFKIQLAAQLLSLED